MAMIVVPNPTTGDSPHSVAGSVSKGTLSGVFANLIRFGTRLVLVPVLISHLGLGGYGIWATLLVIASYLRFGSAGIKTCFQKYVAEAYATGNFDLVNQLLTTGTAIFVGISGLFLIPAAFFAPVLARWIGIPQQYVSSSSAAIMLLAIGYLVSNAMAAFESAVLGAHRVYLMQYASVALMFFELGWSIVILHWGYGITTLALGMAIGETVYAFAGLIVAKRVTPQILLQRKYLAKSVLGELVRFTGSYQLLNIMEIFYFSVVPILLLRELGPIAAGVFALCDRVTRFATIGLEASLVPLLSGSTTVFAAGSPTRMRAFLAKTFKLSLVTTLLPLAVVSAFGPSALLAWTGQRNDLFRLGIFLVALSALFRSLSKVGMVLYRSTGAASMDSGAQLLRIVTLSIVVILSWYWGFYGAISGLVLAELAGMIFMLNAVFRRVGCFSLGRLLSEAAHLSISVIAIVAVGEAVKRIPLPFANGSRQFALVQLGFISLVSLSLVWPSFVLTQYFSPKERTQLLEMLLLRRRATT